MMAGRRVPFFNYQFLYTSRREQYLALMDDVCSRGAFMQQRELARFEENLARYCGSRYAIGVGNATDAMIIGLRAAGIRAGDEVLVCSHTMIATAAAVHFAGGIPVPVEAGPDRLMDFRAAHEAVTAKTRFIMPTHLNGRTANMDLIGGVAAEHGLILLEDAAQALGSKFKGRCAGTFGAASCLSFYPAKVLGCFGDGGAVLCQDPEIADRVLRLRDHGRGSDGIITTFGLNTRLDNLQAAILNVQLSEYAEVVRRRREMAAHYESLLHDVPELGLPPGPDASPEHFDIYQNYEILADRRDGLKAFLEENGVSTSIQWGGQAVHSLRALGFTQSLPTTEEMFRRLLMLPLNMSLGDDDLEYVAGQIRRFYGR